MVRKHPLAALWLISLSGCGQLQAYAWDPANWTVLAFFVGLLFLLFFLTFFLGQPEKKAEKIEATRKERAWLQELGELRNEFVKAQQAVLDRSFELMSDKQKDDAELKRLRLKAHSAMSKVLRLQEEMLKEGVSEARVGTWEEV